MKILVPVKQVATIDEDCELREDGKDVDPDFLDYELNEWDDYSWEEALRLYEKHSDSVEIIPITVGPEEAEDGLRRCLAKGGERAIRVWDDALEGSDPMAVARVIAKVVQNLRLPNGNVKVMVEGAQRAKMIELREDDGSLVADLGTKGAGQAIGVRRVEPEPVFWAGSQQRHTDQVVELLWSRDVVA